jgi:hypothetical protein
MLKHYAGVLTKLLQRIAILLRVLWIFFPGILFVFAGAQVFLNLSQGKDVIVAATETNFRGLFVMLGLIFWVFVTWYSGRLVAYNHDEIFALAPRILYHLPRLLGFICFLVVIAAMAKLPPKPMADWLVWLIVVADLALYLLFHAQFEKIKEGHNTKQLVKYRNAVRILVIAMSILIGYINNPAIYLAGLPVVQLGFLFLVIVRRKIRYVEVATKEANTAQKKELTGRAEKFLGWILIDKNSAKDKDWIYDELKTEKRVFMWFNLISLLAMVIYLATIFNLRFSIFISSFPFVMLAFGILLGFGNFISLLSVKLKINFHFLFITAIFVLGILFEPHGIRIANRDSNDQIFKSRQSLSEFFQNWIRKRKSELTDSAIAQFPIFFVLADGGASRSGYWTASVLAKLEDSSGGKFSHHLFCLSGASGGSVGNVTFFASLYQKNKLPDSANKYLNACQKYLNTDFLTFTIARMLGPDLFKPIFPFPSIYDRAAALEKAVEEGSNDSLISEVMGKPFSNFITHRNEMNYDLPLLCINTTRMQDGRPAVVSNIRVDSLSFGKRIDVLNLLEPGQDVNMSTMMILGARFPYVSPAGRIGNSYFVDGGYFDNSGAGITHEMILELQRIINDSMQINPNHYLQKLKFYIIHTTNSPLEEGRIEKIHPLINDLAAPVKTLVGAYSTQTYVNNLRLFKYLTEINKGDTTYIPFNLYRNPDSVTYSMNWLISNRTLGLMNTRLSHYNKVGLFIKEFKTSNSQPLTNLFNDK